MGCTGNDSVKQEEAKRQGIDHTEKNNEISKEEYEDYKKDKINLQKKIEENEKIQKENEETKRKNEEIQKKYEEMQKEMEEMKKRNEAMQKEKEEMQKQNEKIQKEKEAIKEENEKIQKEKEAIKEENEKIQKEKEAIKEENEKIQKENEKIQKEKEHNEIKQNEKEIKVEENKNEIKEEKKIENANPKIEETKKEEEKKVENVNQKPEETKKEEEKKEPQNESNPDDSTNFNEKDYPLFQSNFYEKFIQNFKKIFVEKEEDGTIKTYKIYATIDHNKKTTSIVEIEIEEKGKEVIRKHLNKNTLNGNSLTNIQSTLEKYNEEFHVDISEYLKIEKTTDVFIRAENYKEEDIGKVMYFIYDKKKVTLGQIKTYRSKKGSGRSKKSYFGMGSDGVVDIINKNTTDFLNYKEESYSALDNTGYNVTDFSDYQQKSLISHNKFRKDHHVPELQLNKELCEISKKYAEHLAKNDLFEHSWARFKGAPMGENLFMAHGFKPPAEDAVKDWYSEIKFYNFKKGTGKGIGHFTQVVWKDTKYMGVYMAQKGKDYYVVANYFPAGNIDGTFTKNVLPK